MSKLLDRLLEEGGWGRVWTGLAMAIALAGGGLVYQQVTSGGGTPPPPGTANLWVDLNGGTCTRQATPGAYADATACPSFSAAYDSASNGDLVLVKAGAYASQTIVRDEKYTTSNTPDVTIRPATGETVTVAELAIGKNVDIEGGSPNAPSNLTLENIVDNGTSGGCYWSIGDAAARITIINGDSCNLYMIRAQDIYVQGGDWGPCTVPTDPCSNMKIQDSNNVTFDGMLIHDFHAVQTSSEHFECLFFVSGDGITIKNNTFRDCAFYDIFIQPYDGRPQNNLTIENNLFEQPWCDTNEACGGSGGVGQNRTGAIAFSGTAKQNVLIRFNSFADGTGISENDDGATLTYTNFRIIGNVMSHPTSCYGSITYAYNVMLSGSTCGTGDVSASASDVYVNSVHLASGGDWHLKPGANTAVDRVTPTTADYLLSTDIDGQARPAGAARDSGADER